MNVQDEKKLPFDPNAIFSISDEAAFNHYALAIFRYQREANPVYASYCDHLKIDANTITDYRQIPFLPIAFFKSHQVVSGKRTKERTFLSSGTTGMQQSQHHVIDTSLYERSFMHAFEQFYGSVEDYLVLGLLPSYLEREGSSLIYMVDYFIRRSRYSESGFFLRQYDELLECIARNKGKKILLIGVSYALLDLAEQYNPDLSHCLIMETGGMKGKRKELTKAELHAQLKKGLNATEIHSEYGMTELLSQAYGIGETFQCPPWMKVLTREYNDPFTLIEGKTGGINLIDLANIHSCSFIATQDLGKVFPDHFEILGRFDHSDLRGCNLLVQ